jgi:drug/metabolite transporter (DMT)-like permease
MMGQKVADEENQTCHLKQPWMKEHGATAGVAVQSRLLGYAWTFATAAISLLTIIVTGLISTAGNIPAYTQNFTRCFAAALSLFVIAKVRGDALLPDRATVRACLVFGSADWFFLWGYVKALIFVTVLEFSAISTAFTPIVCAVLGYVALGETMSRYKMCGLLRNVVLGLMIVDPFSAEISVRRVTTGFIWILVAASGTGVMRLVQRSNDKVPGVVLMFWGYTLNTLLWLPPGSIPPKLRIPILWPSLPQDSTDLFLLPKETWAVMFASGFLGAGIMLAQGQALKHLDVATFSMIVTPLALVLSVLHSAVDHPLELVVWIGIALQVCAVAVDMYLEKR